MIKQTISGSLTGPYYEIVINACGPIYAIGYNSETSGLRVSHMFTGSTMDYETIVDKYNPQATGSNDPVINFKRRRKLATWRL